MELFRYFKKSCKRAGQSSGDIKWLLSIFKLEGFDLDEIRDWKTVKDVDKYGQVALGEHKCYWHETSIPVTDSDPITLRYCDAVECLTKMFSAPENQKDFVLFPGLEFDGKERKYSRPENATWWNEAQVSYCSITRLQHVSCSLCHLRDISCIFYS